MIQIDEEFDQITGYIKPIKHHINYAANDTY